MNLEIVATDLYIAAIAGFDAKPPTMPSPVSNTVCPNVGERVRSGGFATIQFGTAYRQAPSSRCMRRGDICFGNQQ
jgi:hypothetical protein